MVFSGMQFSWSCRGSRDASEKRKRRDKRNDSGQMSKKERSREKYKRTSVTTNARREGRHLLVITRLRRAHYSLSADIPWILSSLREKETESNSEVEDRTPEPETTLCDGMRNQTRGRRAKVGCSLYCTGRNCVGRHFHPHPCLFHKPVFRSV